jgi:RsiW-degrading membrane proteinase PrsW (M82 family)
VERPGVDRAAPGHQGDDEMNTHRVPLWRQRWWQILLSGAVFFFVLARLLADTKNPNLIPSVLVLGAFLVPVTFLAYLGERLPVRDVPLSAIAVCFLWGGAVGISLAGFLEYKTLRDFGVVPMLAIGLIEESVKLAFPLVLFVRGRYRTEAEGLLFGVAAGMGFAALETMGYGFVAFLESRGNLGTLELTLLMRGLLSPAGHAAWTGLVCAVLWRERNRAGHAVVNRAVIGAFALAVVLHALWDTFSTIAAANRVHWLRIELASLVIAVVGLTLLLRRVSEARRSPNPEPAHPLNAVSTV